MSWYEQAKLAAAGVAASAQVAAASAQASVQKTYADLKAYPTSIQCSGCDKKIDLPPTFFDWRCTNEHENDKQNKTCATCSQPKPKLANPTVTCASCGLHISVPTNNASRMSTEAATNAKKFIVQTAEKTKTQVQHLAAAPETFHCAHCNSLLAVPTGAWSCQTCTTENEETAQKCKQCTQKKSDQKAICGVCRQSTVIPGSNFVDSLRANARDLSKSGTKVYLDMAGKAYVTCTRCNTNVRLPSPATATNTNASSTAAVVPPTEPVAPSGEEAKAPSDLESAQIKQLVCPSCKNQIEA